MAQNQVFASEWVARRTGLLVVHVRRDSPDTENLAEITQRCADLLMLAAGVVGIDEVELPTIRLFLGERQQDDQANEPAGTAAQNGVARGERRSTQATDDLAIWISALDEAAAGLAAIELTRSLLAHVHGRQPGVPLFWDEGLAAFVAARSRHDAHGGDAPDQCRKLLRDRALPPIAELVAGSATHLSGLASMVADVFGAYLIERFGLQRYQQLVAATHAAGADRFDEVYPVSLTIAERDWRRQLEAADDQYRASFWQITLRLLPIVRPYWPAGIAVLACSLVGVGFSLALPLSFRFLIDNILGRRPLGRAVPFVGPQGHMIASGQEQIHALLLLLGLLGLLYAANAAARLGMNLLLAVVGESFAFDLRERLVTVLDRLPAGYYAYTSPVDVSQRVVNDVEAFLGVLTRAVVPLFSGGITILGFTALLIALEPKLAVVALAGLPVVAAIHAARRRGRRAAARERARRLSDLAAGVTEAAAGHVVSKLFLAGPYLATRLTRRMEIHKQLNRVFARESAILAQVGTLVLGLIQVAVLLVGAYMIIMSDGRDLAPGSLVAFYLILNQLLGPIGQISTASQSVAGASANVERAAALLEAPVEKDPPGAVEVGPLQREIRFDGVSFAYPDGKLILKGLTLSIPAGSTVAFVGPSGAGKSSILQLLPRLYEPSRGSITWDGADLRTTRLESLRRQIGLVPQDVAMLNATVGENIRLGQDHASDQDVWLASHLAAADDEITRLPQGFDTIVGGGAFNLSAGQRQRVAVARAMLRRPSLLILDEATSALDATRQRAIQERIREHGGGKTVIKVAHRLETVVDADRIFVLDDGRLVEQGSHAELLGRGGLYARLFADQTAPLRESGPL
jgi:ABC-type multidrug transport system fused ATPase/permease subunit